MPKTEFSIHKELHEMFSKLDFPAGKGYFIGTGEEPVYAVYLPYQDDVSGRAENKIAQVTYRLKIDIIARNGASFTEAERKIRELLEANKFDYRNGEEYAETEQPYDYHRVLYYNKNYFFNSFDEE
ncbi:hypothetical protein [Enterococcus phage TJE4]|uniref:Phage protein n=1 Tax=Enterococcus phage 9183 TaxID=2763102 RepID=A0A7L7SU59_9CAUD|nr:hypothetical protein KNV65_gp091 [Enterococcus phage 9183]QOC57584.1 hypothetical protein phi9183_ORF091 [Enterococcus phage 9183]UVD42801.1 hypothetical protein [Enterococcus phage TJE4]